MEQTPLVTVVCMAYNHEPYIRDALEGFVAQRTNFSYVAIVHDDASTDGTARIIAEYGERYPDVVQPICQTENQRSQNVRVFKNVIMPMITSKYVAFCEGDDYWTDPNKLQVQVDALEKNSTYGMCCHAYSKVNAVDGKVVGKDRIARRNKVLTPKQIILYRRPPQLATFLCRRSMLENMPSFSALAGVGDYTRLLGGLLYGGVYYIHKDMSVYRVGVPNSWTQRLNAADEKRQREHKNRIIQYLEAFDEYTHGKYGEWVRLKISRYEYMEAVETKDYGKAKKSYYYEHSGLRDRLGLYARMYFPWLMHWKNRILG